MTKQPIAAGQRLIGAARRARAAKHRTPPRIRFHDETGATARIYYLSPTPSGPRGGVRVFYRHVDLLNAAGFDAVVVHHKPGFRASWFANETRVAAARDVVVTPRDTLVVPEFYGAAITDWPAGPTIVLLNQGAYYTFDGVSLADAAVINGGRVAAILTISQDSVELLRYAFGSVPVHYARSVIEEATFHPPANASSRRRISYATNRRGQERHQLLSILQLHGRPDWPFTPIQGMSEQEVAETMRLSAIFLAFNEREGFGLPPAEAMACGCYVIGYHGQGGREFFDPAYSRPIPDSDLLAFARAVEQAAADYDADPEPLTRAGLAASEAVLGRYTLDGLRADLIAFYTGLGVERSGC
jgi:hypothetical protein